MYYAPNRQQQNNKDNQLKSGYIQRSRDPDNLHSGSWNMEIHCRTDMERCYGPIVELVEKKFYAKREIDSTGLICPS